jgi:uncharacterized protein with PIN domain
MLGTLAKWLRIYGFDTYYVNYKVNDNKLLEISKNENRVLITRDKDLIYRARRENLQVIEINTIDIDEQISIVLNNTQVESSKILSRCLLCNSELNNIKKDGVKDKVPVKVFENFEKFWFCKKCNKIYWNGSHYEKMIEKVQNK